MRHQGLVWGLCLAISLTGLAALPVEALAQLSDGQLFDEASQAFDRHDYTLAVQKYEQLLQQVGPNTPKASGVYTNLSQIYIQQRDYVKAEQAIDKALVLLPQQFGENSSFIGITYTRLAHVYQEQKRYSEMRPALQKAVAILRRYPGNESAITNLTSSLIQLGMLSLNENDGEVAHRYFNEALQVHTEAERSPSSNTALTYIGLAHSLRLQKRYADALPYYEKGIQLHKALGIRLNMVSTLEKEAQELKDYLANEKAIEHNRILEDSNFVQGQHFFEENAFDTALPYFQFVIQKYDPKYDPTNGTPLPIPEYYILAMTYRYMAYCHLIANDSKQAERYLREALAIHQTHVKVDNDEHGLVSGRLGEILFKQKRYAEAEEHLAYAREHVEDKTSKNYTLRLNLWAQSLYFQKQYALAENALQEVLTLQKTLYGTEDYHTKITQERLERLAQYRAHQGTPHYLTIEDPDLTRWGDHTETIKVYIQPTLNSALWRPDYIELIRKAFLEWQTALDNRFTFVFVEQPEAVDVKVQWSEGPIASELTEDYQVVLGTREFQVFNHLIAQANITIALSNAEGVPQTANDILFTALHEAGHLLGLAHSNDPEDIMVATDSILVKNQDNRVITLSQRDIDTIQLLYSLPTQNTNPKGLRVTQYHHLIDELLAIRELVKDGKKKKAYKAFEKIRNLVVNNNVGNVLYGQLAYELKDYETTIALLEPIPFHLLPPEEKEGGLTLLGYAYLTQAETWRNSYGSQKKQSRQYYQKGYRILEDLLNNPDLDVIAKYNIENNIRQFKEHEKTMRFASPPAYIQFVR